MAVRPPLRFVVVASEPGSLNLAPWQAACLENLVAAGLAAAPEVISSADLDRVLHAHTPDVCLSFAEAPIAPNLLALPRLGVWSFTFGRAESWTNSSESRSESQSEPLGFAELREGRPVVEAALVRLTSEGAGLVLVEGAFPTKLHSLRWTRATVLRGVAPWLAKAVRDLAAGVQPQTAQRRLAGPPRAPGQIAAAAHALRAGKRFLRAQFGGIASGAKWNVGVIPRPIDQIPDGPLTGVRWFPEPERGVFLADPFPCCVFLSGTGQPSVLLERLQQRESVGTLAAYSLDGQPLGQPVPRMPVHLSYPFTFTHEGTAYCVPESAQGGAVRLFRFDDAAGEWVSEADLLSGRRLLDPTVLHHEGRWWLLATDADLGGMWSLHAWWAQDPRGPWHEHAANPVKTDVRSARPAGTPFLRDGRLIRPAQDCSGSYGSAVVLNEILELSPTRFVERPAGRVEPADPYPDGLHTLSAAGAVTLVDGKRSEFSWGHARREIKARLSRLRR